MKAQKPTPFGLAAERAFQEAVRDAIEEHRLRGVPIAVMRGGKAVNIPAEEAFPGRKAHARNIRQASQRPARRRPIRSADR